jgi:hypothetical protein
MRRYGISRAELVELAAQVVRRGGCLAFRAHGPSMAPSVTDGERVTVGPLPPGGPRHLDLVLARTNRGPRLHRVVAVGEDSVGRFYTLKGDSDSLPPLSVRGEDLIGLIVAVHHCPRRLLSLRRLLHAVSGTLRRLADGGTLGPRGEDDIVTRERIEEALRAAGAALRRASPRRLPVDLE